MRVGPTAPGPTSWLQMPTCFSEGPSQRALHPQSCQQAHCGRLAPHTQAAATSSTPPRCCREPCPGGGAASRDLGPLPPCEHHTCSAPRNQTTLQRMEPLLLPGHPEKGPCCPKQGPKQILTRALPGWEGPILGWPIGALEKLFCFKASAASAGNPGCSEGVYPGVHLPLNGRASHKQVSSRRGGPREQQWCWVLVLEALTPGRGAIKTHEIDLPWGGYPACLGVGRDILCDPGDRSLRNTGRRQVLTVCREPAGVPRHWTDHASPPT